MDYTGAFSVDYQSARQRFLELCNKIVSHKDKFVVSVSGVEDGTLTIDTALIDNDSPNLVVVSSGLHGVEGFMGSAIQSSWLERSFRQGTKPGNCSVYLIHAINPYGFEFLRRVNEDNVDLNRNFLHTDFEKISNQTYAKFHPVLNPDTLGRFDTFYFTALGRIIRYGFRNLKTSITKGQYDYPEGLFYGGEAVASSTQIIQNNYCKWIAGFDRVIHIDFHSGLGKYGTYKLLVVDQPDSGNFVRLTHNFTNAVESVFAGQGVAYSASATMSDWLNKSVDCDYTHLAAEFGTYSSLRVLNALVKENAVHHHLHKNDPEYNKAKSELLECFCPSDALWRNKVVSQGLTIIDQAMNSFDRGS